MEFRENQKELGSWQVGSEKKGDGERDGAKGKQVDERKSEKIEIWMLKFPTNVSGVDMSYRTASYTETLQGGD